MSEEYGAGVALDRSLDFVVDHTGDIKSSFGLDELEKDLAFQMQRYLSDYLGQPVTNNLRSQVRADVSAIAAADNRIESALKEDVSVEWNERRRKIEISMIVTANDEEQRLVFEVS